MKNGFFKLSIIAFIVISIFPFNVSAATVDCNELLFAIELMDDGSAVITESWTFDYPNNDYSRFTRSLLYADWTYIDDISVMDKDGNKYNEISSSDSNRPEGSFAFKDENEEIKIEAYHRTRNASRTFIVKYTVHNIVILHKDTAEFYYKIYDGVNDIGPIGVVQASITFPSEAVGDGVRIWAHSGVRGETAIDSSTMVSFYSEDVPTNYHTELRLLLPTELFPKSENKTSKSAFESILEEEQKFSNDTSYSGYFPETDFEIIAEALDIDKDYVSFGVLGISIILPGALLLGLKKLSKKNTGKSTLVVKRHYQPSLAPEFYRELPSDITPAEMALLMRFVGKLQGSTANGYSATMLDLSLKGYLTFTQEKKKIIIGLPENVDIEKLQGHEKILYNIIYDSVWYNGDRDTRTVRVTDMSKYIRNNAEEMQKKLREFDNEVEYGLTGRDFYVYENHSKIYRNFFADMEEKSIFKMNLLLILISAGLLLASLFTEIIWLAIGGLVIITIIFGLYRSRKDKKYLSQKAEDEGALWDAFVNFLEEFTMFKDRELPELVIWEKYLVYATAAGVSKKVLKKLPLAYPEINSTDLNQTAFLYLMLNSGNNRLFDSKGGDLFGALNVFENSTKAAANYDNSSGSGGSGFGGSSSFGGGFGGGGGGVGND